MKLDPDRIRIREKTVRSGFHPVRSGSVAISAELMIEHENVTYVIFPKSQVLNYLKGKAYKNSVFQTKNVFK